MTANIIRVMIVDDHPQVRYGLSVFLDLWDDLQLVGEADNGEKALALAAQLHPNIILMDLSMPRMDGWKTRIQIRLDAKYQEVAIIALSAHAMQGDIERALKAGFDGYITKPIHIARIEEDIRTTVFENAKLNKEQAESA